MASNAQFGSRILVSIAALALAVAGCSKGSVADSAANGDQPGAKPAGGVAVVDLDQIAKRLGQDAEMNRSIEQATASVNEQLKTIHERLRREYQDEVAKVAPSAADTEEGTASPADTAEAAAIKQRYDRQLAQITGQAQEKLTQHRSGVVERFRSQVRPVAEKIAASRGQSIVVTKNDAVVFAFLPQADITDAVVDQMQSHVKPASFEEP